MWKASWGGSYTKARSGGGATEPGQRGTSTPVNRSATPSMPPTLGDRSASEVSSRLRKAVAKANRESYGVGPATHYAVLVHRLRTLGRQVIDRIQEHRDAA